MLDGLSKPEQIAERLVECGYAGTALTDHGSIGGVPGLLKAASKKNLKGIAGCEFYVCRQDATVKTKDNRDLSHLCVLAKSAAGWKNLMRASSESFRPEFSYFKPRLNIERIGEFGKGEFIAFSGHMGSDLANVCFEDHKLAYGAKTYDDARALVRKDWKEAVSAEIARYQAAFGRENFYLEIQLVDQANLPASLVVARILRFCGEKLGVRRVATADSHYCRREDAPDQRILLCSALETTLREVERKIAAGEDVSLGAFFKSNNYHIPSPEEMRELHSDRPDELETSLEIAGRCESYKVGGKPLFPAFPDTNGMGQDEYLVDQLKKGWAKFVEGKIKREEVPTYENRLWAVEHPVVAGTDGFLASYFNVKADIVRHAREDLKAKTGLGRGSAAGCLISYLTGITRLDPILHGLSFERFYSAARNSPGNVSLPDIDTDFPIRTREKVIEYVRNKYGRDRVCQMATFSRMQGRGALKDVLRAKERCSFEEMNEITKAIPDEAEIADELQVMREETGEASIIRWALENTPDRLKDWAVLQPDGTVVGPYAVDFEQAIRLEGTKRSMGKHASGVVICSVPLAEVCPMVYDKGVGEMITGVDMKDAESLGLVKVDILGLRTLDCLEDWESLCKHGFVPED